MNEELLEALEDLLEAIPPQSNDRDWWPDELNEAVRNAKRIINKAYNQIEEENLPSQ